MNAHKDIVIIIMSMNTLTPARAGPHFY